MLEVIYESFLHGFPWLVAAHDAGYFEWLPNFGAVLPR